VDGQPTAAPGESSGIATPAPVRTPGVDSPEQTPLDASAAADVPLLLAGIAGVVVVVLAGLVVARRRTAVP
jgi:hypothetical protein